MRLVIVGSAVAVLVGCGGGDNGGTGPDPVPASVSLSASTSGTVTSLNATRTLTASVRDANQTVIPAAAVTWTASPAGIVNLSATSGASITLTAVANGSSVVTARSGTVTAMHNVTVAQEFASLELTPDPGTVLVGGTLQLLATAHDPGGAPLPAGGTITFASSDESKATVDGSGLVSGLAAGTTQITAQASRGGVDRTDNAAITVSSQAFPLTASVVAGNATQTFTPQTVDIAFGGTVTWTFGALAHNVTFGAQAGAPQNIALSMNTDVPRTFNTAGTFGYDCTIHPGMSGTVVVH
ncbi:MAG TPA: Ig-like domain-containing protein [Gemmatimonadaceae bacterium]|nr:Ig-like domain-containing protein [Gemmatimonadaceae bacterium]